METTDLSDIKVWKTITIGEGKFKSSEDVMEALLECGAIHKNHLPFHSPHSTPKMSHTYQNRGIPFFRDHFIRLNEKKEEVKLVYLRNRIVLKEGEVEVSFEELCQRVRKYGLVPCPQETPVTLALALDPDEFQEPEFQLGLYVTTTPFKYADTLLSVKKRVSLPNGHGTGSLAFHLYAGYRNYIPYMSPHFIFRLIQN